MSQVTFRIQDEPYSVELADLAARELEIRSVPRPYAVRQAPGGAAAEVARLLAERSRARLLVDAKVRALHLAGLQVEPRPGPRARPPASRSSRWPAASSRCSTGWPRRV